MLIGRLFRFLDPDDVLKSSGWRIIDLKAGSNKVSKRDQMPIEGFNFRMGRFSDGGRPDAVSFRLWTTAGKKEATLHLKYARNSYNLVFENCTGVSAASLKFELRFQRKARCRCRCGPPGRCGQRLCVHGLVSGPRISDRSGLEQHDARPQPSRSMPSGRSRIIRFPSTRMVRIRRLRRPSAWRNTTRLKTRCPQTPPVRATCSQAGIRTRRTPFRSVAAADRPQPDAPCEMDAHGQLHLCHRGGEGHGGQ